MPLCKTCEEVLAMEEAKRVWVRIKLNLPVFENGVECDEKRKEEFIKWFERIPPPLKRSST